MEKRYYDFFNKCQPGYEEVHDKLKSAFLKFFSHKVRTHMNSIVGFADLLRGSDISQAESEHYINNIIKSGKILLNTIDDNVSLAKIETNEMRVYNSNFEINSLIDEINNEFIEEIADNHIESIKFIAHKESRIELDIQSDKGKLKTIFTHLLNNAFEFTSNGTIEFGYRITNDVKLECFVRYSGVGLFNERLNGIQRANEKSEFNYQNKEYGFKIIKGFLELMEGELIVESDPAHGTNVNFILPLVFAKNQKIS
ncbi:MAG: HAMP domain-containing histidine kinase [Saprospiraceae bacterium]|nr:HAMP domain-containing histidine kinase [Saprospiraceae bacterium]